MIGVIFICMVLCHLSFFGRWPVTCECNRSSLMVLKVSFPSVWFSVLLIRFMLFSLLFCWFSVGFVTPRTSWGVLEGPWGALRVLGSSPGRFWDLLERFGGSQGGVQSSLLGGEYVTNTGVLELVRLSVACRGVWILFVFSMFVLVWFLWIGEVNSL